MNLYYRAILFVSSISLFFHDSRFISCGATATVVSSTRTYVLMRSCRVAYCISTKPSLSLHPSSSPLLMRKSTTKAKQSQEPPKILKETRPSAYGSRWARVARACLMTRDTPLIFNNKQQHVNETARTCKVRSLFLTTTTTCTYNSLTSHFSQISGRRSIAYDYEE